MLKKCSQCGKIFNTDYPTQLYCSKYCSKAAYYKRDESQYDFPHAPDADPLFTFQCANCGKTVNVYSKYDQRTKFCCDVCARRFKTSCACQHLAKQRYTSNIGMSGGMSLGGLIRREAASVDKEKVVEVKICPVCGKKFDVTPRRQKYCSLACKQTALLKKLAKETDKYK